MAEMIVTFENNEVIKTQEASYIDDCFKETEFVDPVVEPMSV